MSQYILTSLARKDLKEINNYLIRFNPSIARRVKNKIKQQCERIADYPILLLFHKN